MSASGGFGRPYRELLDPSFFSIDGRTSESERGCRPGFGPSRPPGSSFPKPIWLYDWELHQMLSDRPSCSPLRDSHWSPRPECTPALAPSLIRHPEEKSPAVPRRIRLTGRGRARVRRALWVKRPCASSLDSCGSRPESGFRLPVFAVFPSKQAFVEARNRSLKGIRVGRGWSEPEGSDSMRSFGWEAGEW